jgi:hypothetical protein
MKNKIIFQRFVDREGNEIGRRSKEAPNSSNIIVGNQRFSLQFFEIEKGLTVAVYRLKDKKVINSLSTDISLAKENREL